MRIHKDQANIPSGTDMIFYHAEAEEIVTQEKTKSARKKKAREPTAAPITNRTGTQTRTRDIKAPARLMSIKDQENARDELS